MSSARPLLPPASSMKSCILMHLTDPRADFWTDRGHVVLLASLLAQTAVLVAWGEFLSTFMSVTIYGTGSAACMAASLTSSSAMLL
jgi:hypothetical protein